MPAVIFFHETQVVTLQCCGKKRYIMHDRSAPDFPQSLIISHHSIFSSKIFHNYQSPLQIHSSEYNPRVKMGFTSYSGPASSPPPMSSWKTFEEICNINKFEMLQTGDANEDARRIWNPVLEAAEVCPSPFCSLPSQLDA